MRKCLLPLTLAAASSTTTARASELKLEELFDPSTLGFKAKADPPTYTINIDVGIMMDHLYSVNDQTHLFESVLWNSTRASCCKLLTDACSNSGRADFYTIYTWHDQRDYSSLFNADSWTQSPLACGKPARLEFSAAPLLMIHDLTWFSDAGR